MEAKFFNFEKKSESDLVWSDSVSYVFDKSEIYSENYKYRKYSQLSYSLRHLFHQIRCDACSLFLFANGPVIIQLVLWKVTCLSLEMGSTHCSIPLSPSLPLSHARSLCPSLSFSPPFLPYFSLDPPTSPIFLHFSLCVSPTSTLSSEDRVRSRVQSKTMRLQLYEYARGTRRWSALARRRRAPTGSDQSNEVIEGRGSPLDDFNTLPS